MVLTSYNISRLWSPVLVHTFERISPRICTNVRNFILFESTGLIHVAYFKKFINETGFFICTSEKDENPKK